MSGIKDYSTTPASNTALFPEGMAPSAVNDGMRQVQADLRSWYNDSQWIVYGDGDGTFTIAYVSPTSFSVNGADVTDGLEIASNGVHGRLHGLLDGPNRLRLEVFGRGRWPAGLLVEQACELEVLYRPPSGLDRG